MRALDNDALICDFAQYYHIYDFKSLDLKTAAILACGLPKESRIMTIVTGTKIKEEKLIQIAILDTLRAIAYAYTKTHSDGKTEMPEFRSVLAELLGSEEQEKTDMQQFGTADDFKENWKKATGKVEDNV